MLRSLPPVLMLAVALSGCSGGGGVSTSSILGSDPPTPPPQAAFVPSDPTTRAFHVGSVSARAAKCGYNFDAARLKGSYFAYEQANGLAPEALAKVQQTHDVAYAGVGKAAAEDPNYCSEQKTRVIKADLNRLLAGDYEPPKRLAQKQDDGLFSGWFDGSSGDSGPKFGSDAWWEKQKEATGN